MSTAIRRATPDDIPAILALERRSPTAAHWSTDEYRKLVTEGFVQVAEQKDEICGMVCAKPVAGEWELENIVVAESVLRRGVADALVRTLFDHVRRAMPSRISLEVRESNLPARRLYEKHGFREVGRRPNYYQEPPDDAILYTHRFK